MKGRLGLSVFLVAFLVVMVGAFYEASADHDGRKKRWRHQKRYRNHAEHYETSMAMALFPERVHVEDMEEESSAKLGTLEKGQALIQPAVDGVTEILRKMIAGEEIDLEPCTFKKDGVQSMIRDHLIQPRDE